jgi:hypothetical protein
VTKKHSRETRFLPEHDPEKWTPVFRKDHAQTRVGENALHCNDAGMELLHPA